MADGAVKITGRSTVPGGKLRWEILRVDGNRQDAVPERDNATASADAAQSGCSASR